MKRVGISFEVEAAVAKKLDAKAKKLGISRSDVLRSMIRLYLDKEVSRGRSRRVPVLPPEADGFHL